MAVIDHAKQFRGHKAKLGSPIYTDDQELRFFAGYCDCGHKHGLSPEQAREFAKQFYREREPRILRLLAAPGRMIHHLWLTLQEASKLVSTQKERL